MCKDEGTIKIDPNKPNIIKVSVNSTFANETKPQSFSSVRLFYLFKLSNSSALLLDLSRPNIYGFFCLELSKSRLPHDSASVTSKILEAVLRP